MGRVIKLIEENNAAGMVLKLRSLDVKQQDIISIVYDSGHGKHACYYVQ